LIEARYTVFIKNCGESAISLWEICFFKKNKQTAVFYKNSFNRAFGLPERERPAGKTGRGGKQRGF
jgi:hypothetical protein